MAKKISQAKKSSAAASESEVIHAEDSDFDAIVQEHPLCVVDFFTTWCPPCRELGKAMEKTIIPHFAGKNVTFIKVDADRTPELCRRFKISAIPLLLFFKDGKKVKFDFTEEDGEVVKTDKIEGFTKAITNSIIAVIEKLLE